MSASRIASTYWEISRMSFQNISWEGFATIPENGAVALPGGLFKSCPDVALAYEKTANRHFMVGLRMFMSEPACNIWASPGNKMNMLTA
ncbi:hypothetical protein [Sphingobacterium corticibacterium]|uniref:Uncharacterized protein n=1 Tax=Sphingobacterium corticibacterium TaxID=2484746 RepID=A0A4Q6Y0R7_9SPHI|nr:hypothetical protein [Sphingobacterium corticibacterium]RZF62566.1 hypothetical protein EWE74_07160 [Sphingobacterium corticibacterium]